MTGQVWGPDSDKKCTWTSQINGACHELKTKETRPVLFVLGKWPRS